MISPQEVITTIQSKYPDEYFSIHISRYKYLVKLISQLHIPERSIALDVGCYPSHISEGLSLMGFEVYGIASEHEQIKSKNITVLNIEKDRLPHSDNKFDLIIFTEILEHLAFGPNFVFNELSRVLKPGGYLIITTPNVLRWQNVFSLLFKKNIYFPLSQLDQPINFRHVREYTSREIIGLCQQSRLKIITSKTFVAYSPFRQRNRTLPIYIKVIKLLNYLAMSISPQRRDTILIVASK